MGAYYVSGVEIFAKRYICEKGAQLFTDTALMNQNALGALSIMSHEMRYLPDPLGDILSVRLLGEVPS
jgi:hypothetical protein